jgi:hypothetical protein
MGHIYAFEINELAEIKSKSGDFNRYGIYILVWKTSPGEAPQVYVGKSKNVQNRIGHHVKSYDRSGWDHAYVFVSAHFHDTYISELEAHLIEFMKERRLLRKHQSYAFGNVPDALSKEISRTSGAILQFVESREEFQGLIPVVNPIQIEDSSNTVISKKKDYLNLSHILADIDDSFGFAMHRQLLNELLQFCLSHRDVEFTKRRDKNFPRYAASVFGKNFLIVNVKRNFITIDVGLDRAERENTCNRSTDANGDKFCSHNLSQSGLTDVLKGHIEKAYRLRAGM